MTIDVDWAPEYCIERCINIFRKSGVKATIFVTHPSPALRSLINDPQFELGVHPNFLPKSSHGSTVQEVMDYSLSLVPDAQSMRTHALVQSSHIYAEIADRYPSIITDVSLYLPFHADLQPTDLYIGRSSRRLTRLPYFWEDDLMTLRPNWDWESVPQTQGLAIYDFHPVYIELNMTKMQGYETIRNQEPWRPLYERKKSDFAPYIETGIGTRTFLQKLISSYPAEAFMTISEITSIHRKKSA